MMFVKLFPELDINGIFALLQRYHHFDLWPCSSGDMFAFGKNSDPLLLTTQPLIFSIEGPVTIQEHTRGPPTKSERSQPAHVTAAQLALEKASKFPKPNINAMIPFKSEMALLQVKKFTYKVRHIPIINRAQIAAESRSRLQ